MGGKRESEIDIKALQSGDEGAWETFFAKYDSLINSVASWPKWRLNKHAQEDVAQVVRRELVRSIGNYREESNIEYFIKRICINRIIDEIRRQVRKDRPTISIQQGSGGDEDGYEIPLAADESFDPVKQVVQYERANALKKLVAELDDLCEVAIQEFYFQGLPYKDMAERHEISINTVGSRLSKCLNKLRKLMREHDGFKDDS